MDDALSIGLRLLLVVALVLLNGLFVAAEFSIVTARRSRLEEMAEKGNPLARFTLRASRDLNNYLAACQLGITVVSIALGFLGEPLLADLLEPLFEDIMGEKAAGISSHAVAVPIAFAVITSLHIIFGEQVPKVIALGQPERLALFTTPPTETLRYALWPAIWILNAASNAVVRPFGLKVTSGHQVLTPEEINLIVTHAARAGVLEEDEAELLSGVFQFGDRRVNEVMVPRTEVVWLTRGSAIREFYAVYTETPHSRFPVFEGNHDNVVGVVSIKDVLRGIADGSFNDDSVIDDAMRAPLFIPETKFVAESFFQMQESGVQMAIVVDEYGGTAGIVTLEMMIEELVGYVGDELRRHEEEFEKVDERTFKVDAGMTVHDANEELDLNLPEDEDFETIAGFVLSRLGRIPEPGETITHDGLRITVTNVEGNRIEEVTITRE
jgi:CBS domain containing-hemolysin-like protein